MIFGHWSLVIGHWSLVICPEINHLDRAGLVTLGWAKNDSSETRPYIENFFLVINYLPSPSAPPQY
ncbi:hypothetical protein MC7420_5564 [Coleofasciculus chthonoplastes PCC 7420]|uniref:Uncharacterized protein n=1 Tax=Coleofasciculus chthonoplastes PCC 7420 TaxID=118168 RepID=B4VPH6_9CYAN|nr:hypothetical protein [Coleofasciculus chthonoplastes]EDX76130.1 hypothetical protein MC7420_5564 [Coleofasciculus chthonoplastes PCC 7420]